MPKLDGLDATRLLRERGFDLPIVAVTASAFDEDRERCRAAGMNAFLPKPWTPEELEDVLRRLPPIRSGGSRSIVTDGARADQNGRSRPLGVRRSTSFGVRAGVRQVLVI